MIQSLYHVIFRHFTSHSHEFLVLVFNFIRFNLYNIKIKPSLFFKGQVGGDPRVDPDDPGPQNPDDPGGQQDQNDPGNKSTSTIGNALYSYNINI